MDEKQISELLECSVCLEQLDQTCKVLPCQHTFCRRCLDEILLTKHELRCPECRATVTVRVADLPTNIMVVRILEGLKTQGQQKSIMGRGGGKFASNLGSSTAKTQGSGHHHMGYHQRQISQPCAKALYNYESSEKEDLPFKKGDTIMLRRQVDENWFHGEMGGRTGFVPANFVQVLVPLPQIPQCRALYDFDLKDENEKDCLSFKKEEILTVIRKVDENWLEGRKGEKIGIFPITFVELNDSARSLINSKSNLTILPSATISSLTSTPCSSNAASQVATVTPSSVTSTATTAVSETNTTTTVTLSHTSTASSTSAPVLSSSSMAVDGSPARQLVQTPACVSNGESGVSQHKRHSYTSSLSTPLIAVSASSSQQRHSMEVTVSSSGSPSALETSAVTLTTDSTSTPTVSPFCVAAEVEASSSAKSSPRHVPSKPGSPSTAFDVSSETGNGQTAISNTLTAPVYIALYNYKPQKEDELELIKGDSYTVVEKCQDGWFKGACVKTGIAGVFPGNYVNMIRHSSAFKPVNPNVLNIRAKGPAVSAPAPTCIVSCASSNAVSTDQRSAYGTSDITTSQAAPPLMPRVAKMNPSGQKSRSPSSQLSGGGPVRSLSSPGVSTSSSPKHLISLSSTVASSVHHGFSRTAQSTCVPAAPASSSTSSPHRSLWMPPNMSAMQKNMSASVNITPPNVVMAPSQDSSASALASASKEKKEKKDKEKKGLVKLLSGKGKKSKQTTSDTGSSLSVLCFDNVAHVRSGSFPVVSSASSSVGGSGDSAMVSLHRKANSLDSTSTTTPPIPAKPRPKPVLRERYRCIVPYPPQTDHELSLELGDIIHVHRKREDGWYKGTQERTGKTGMFPAIFVEKCD